MRLLRREAIERLLWEGGNPSARGSHRELWDGLVVERVERLTRECPHCGGVGWTVGVDSWGDATQVQCPCGDGTIDAGHEVFFHIDLGALTWPA